MNPLTKFLNRPRTRSSVVNWTDDDGVVWGQREERTNTPGASRTKLVGTAFKVFDPHYEPQVPSDTTPEQHQAYTRAADKLINRLAKAYL